MSDEQTQQAGKKPSTPLYRSKTFMAMGVFTVIGGALWVYALATAPKVPEKAAQGSSQTSSGLDRSLVSGFGADGEGKGTTAVPQTSAEPEKRLVDNAPKMFTVGVSFMGGFLLAWGVKKFIKLTLLVAAVGIGGVYLLKKYGVHDVGGIETEDIEQHVNQGVEYAKQEAGHVAEWVKQYLPSSVSGVAGAFFGARKG